ncbi:MAG: hypothetical protein PWP31_1647 [Clostridia bacterium]|nr:hypothetical protein [Clostridia bacterium]
MTHKVKWLGHATCQITTEKGKVMLIDPWITDNPNCPVGLKDINNLDIIMVTHDHFDHVGTDIPELVKTTGATVIAQPEIASKLKEAGVNEANIINGMGMNIGGEVKVDGIKITMTQAMHSSETGDPAGYIITLEDGTTIYHAGDTGIFASMEIFGKLYDIDVALLPIGSVFTMGPKQAAYSVNLLKPRKVIPIHYKTFPILVQDAKEFVKLCKTETEILVIDPGQEIEI